MKTKLARVFLRLSGQCCRFAEWLARVPESELLSVEDIQKIYQTSYVGPKTINVASNAAPPKPGTTAIVHCGDDELHYTCISTEPSKDGLGFDCKLQKIEAVDVFAGE